MKWLENAIANYDVLSDSEKAHVDATLDNLSEAPVEEGVCVCGTKDCPDAYSHTTGGY
tara:strand:+ start:954 stop:1127 length:174 start_codon:yes stop_codon:yes gene_type:complete